MVSMIWKSVFLILAASKNVYAVEWKKYQVLDIIEDPSDNEPLEFNRENGYEFDNENTGEIFIRFNEAMNELGRPVVTGNAISIDSLKKYTVKYRDGGTKELNLVLCSGASVKANYLYLQKLGDDAVSIYTILSDDEPSTSNQVTGILWTKVEVSSVHADPADYTPLDSNQENGYDFVVKYRVHYMGAMEELGKSMMGVDMLKIGRLKKYTVKHKDGRVEKLNLVGCYGVGLTRIKFYLRKFEENHLYIYTVPAESDDEDSSIVQSRLDSIRWTKKKALSVTSDPDDDRPSIFDQHRGYHFEGNFETHFTGAMRELGRPIMAYKSLMIGHLEKYAVKFSDGRVEQLNLIQFEGAGEPGNRFFLQNLGENNYCIYTVTGDDHPSIKRKLERIRWTKKDVLSVTRDPADDTPVVYDQHNGYFFEGNFDTHFVGAMREIDRPIMTRQEFVIGELKKYTVKYENDRTEKLNLVPFSGGGERGNVFYLKRVDENDFCIYTVIGENDFSIIQKSAADIRWTIEEVLTIYSDPADDAPLADDQGGGRYFEGNYRVHFVGAMKELDRPILPNSFRISKLKKYTVIYIDDLRAQQLNLVAFIGGSSEPGNRFYLQELDENNYRIFIVIGDANEYSVVSRLGRMYMQTKEEASSSVDTDPGSENL